MKKVFPFVKGVRMNSNDFKADPRAILEATREGPVAVKDGDDVILMMRIPKDMLPKDREEFEKQLREYYKGE